MGKMVAIEGVDGAGKFTVSNFLKAVIERNGKTAAIISFPRYSETIAGKALGEFLSGKTYLPKPKSIAVLYGMDRFESKELIEEYLSSFDFLICDRYIASNVAYQSAKVSSQFQNEMIQWVANLELEAFDLPSPSLNVYLRITPKASAQNVLKKPRRNYTELEADRHEADDSLLSSVPLVYERLVEESILGNWLTVDVDSADDLRTPEEIANEIWSKLNSQPIDH